MSGILKQFLANPTAGFTNGLQISDFFRKRK